MLREQLTQHVTSTKRLHTAATLGQRTPVSIQNPHSFDEQGPSTDKGLDFDLLDDTWLSLWTEDPADFCPYDDDQDMMNGNLL